ncbi:MAG: hypothetical protein F6K24_12130 [Okeania sp. SIO2D1]|nr:hypothetical protein [Okeania sp. SIO2D1]
MTVLSASYILRKPRQLALAFDLDFHATFCRAECGFDDAVINKKYANKIESVAT